MLVEFDKLASIFLEDSFEFAIIVVEALLDLKFSCKYKNNS